MAIIYKIVIVGLLLVVIFNLGQALYFMMTDRGHGNRTVWALTRRIGLSVLVLVLILVGIKLGWIHPHGIDPRL